MLLLLLLLLLPLLLLIFFSAVVMRFFFLYVFMCGSFVRSVAKIPRGQRKGAVVSMQRAWPLFCICKALGYGPDPCSFRLRSSSLFSSPPSSPYHSTFSLSPLFFSRLLFQSRFLSHLPLSPPLRPRPPPPIRLTRRPPNRCHSQEFGDRY